MSKKRYSLPKGISDEISSTVDLVESNLGTLNYKVVPISAIEFDPENPRELLITRDELPNGPLEKDPFYDQKMEELGSLKQLSETVKKYGVRNAVEIYKHGTGYRLIHGERRCLSSILAGKTHIPAKILDKKPSTFDIKLLQFIENIQREDLSLHETLNNIRSVIKEYQNVVDPNVKIDASFLEKLINRSKPHCLNFLAVLNADKDLQEAIKTKKIKSLEKASIIAKTKDQEKRAGLLKACLAGASLKEMKESFSNDKRKGKISYETLEPLKKKRTGKPPSKVNLGSTLNRGVIKKLSDLVEKDSNYSQFKSYFEEMSFEDYGACAESFSKLIKLMERVEKNQS